MDFRRHTYIETVLSDNVFPHAAQINRDSSVICKKKKVLNKSAHPRKCWSLKLSNTGTCKQNQETNEIPNLKERQKQEDVSQTALEVGQRVRMGWKPSRTVYFERALQTQSSNSTRKWVRERERDRSHPRPLILKEFLPNLKLSLFFKRLLTKMRIRGQLGSGTPVGADGVAQW